MGLGIRTALNGWGRRWRSWFARKYLVVSIGKGCDLRPGCVIEYGRPAAGQDYKGIILGDGVVLFPGVVLTIDAYNDNSGIAIGNNTWINRNTLIHGIGGVTIGNEVLFGPGVVVWSGGHEYKSSSGAVMGKGLTSAPVVIGDGAWIGAGAIILAGVTIGKGAVVGAGSIVTKDVREGVIVAGNPAMEIGRRGEK